MQNQSADQLHGNRAAPLFTLHKTYNPSSSQIQGALWLSGRVRTLEREVGGLETYLPPPIVSLSKTLFSPKVLVIHRKWGLCPNMTENLLTWTLNLNTNKHNFTNPKFQASSLCGCTARSQTLKFFL